MDASFRNAATSPCNASFASARRKQLANNGRYEFAALLHSESSFLRAEF